MDNSWWANVKRAGYAGDGPKAEQTRADQLARGADGAPDYSRTIKDKTVDQTADQTDAMKRRMDQAGGN